MSRAMMLPPEDGYLADGSRVGGWWEQSEDGERLSCNLCPRGCSLGPGDRGFCFVRENRDGQMVSTTYGRSTGFCIDPIEKKPLHQFYPGSSVLSFGTAGCNLGCKFCQNWTTTKSRDVASGSEAADPEAIAEAAQRLDCRSVAFTYNDPIIWTEYAIETAKACRRRGIKTVAVTSGYMAPAPREAFYEHIDAANVDLKGFTEDFYRRLTGGHLEPVLDTLRWIAHRSSVWLEITNLVIPRENDSPEEIERMCRWIVEELGPDVPLHFSAFHPDFKLRDHEPTPLETLISAHDIARRAGLRYVYTGNVADRTHQATYCPGCNRVVIGRDGYLISDYRIRGGCCAECGVPIAGRLEDAPGDWGGRRMPVRIADYASMTVARRQRTAPERPEGDQGPSQNQLTGKEVRNQESPGSRPHPNPLPEGEGTVGRGAKPSGGRAAPGGSPGTVPRPSLTEEQEKRIFRAAGCRVVAVVRSQPMAESVAAMLGDAAEASVYGTFVSLKRGGQLRSCCGFLGQTVPLWEALDHAAIRAAKDDPRFPPISPTELDRLDMEVWILWGLEPVTARGRDRVAAITIGKHGVQIARGAARGLLLPGVAVEHHLDAEAFLQQVCLKAGLPPDAWLRDDATLMTFEGYAIHGRLATIGLSEGARAEPGGPPPAEVVALADFCRGNLTAMLCGATPSSYLPGGLDGGVHGLALTLGPAGTDQRIECSRLSLRPDMPLQSTLYSLTEAAAVVLRSRRTHPDSIRTVPIGLTVLTDPCPHATAAKPELAGLDPRRRAVLVASPSGSAWAYDPEQTAEGLLEQAMAAAERPDPERTHVYSLAVVSTEARVTVAQLDRARRAPEVRAAAVAGAFYPGSPREIDRELDEMFAAAGEKPAEHWPAALVPHAGWVYSGRLAAAVLRRLKIPDRIVVLCPRHRPVGANWAVAPHARWALPGGEVASDPELAQRLAGAITGLELDALAHRPEHAIEVQLPLLARLAPAARVVGISIGSGDWPALEQFGRQLAGVLKDMADRPLLLISSDMNHFEDEVRTRQVDRMALDAMESLDPARLFETVERHEISMCGMRPAVIVLEALRELGELSRCEVVGYTTSAEASGDTSRVVGYAGVLFG